MVEKKDTFINDEKLNSMITFLKLTKDGEFTEVPPVVVEFSRATQLRIQNDVEDSFGYYYS